MLLKIAAGREAVLAVIDSARAIQQGESAGVARELDITGLETLKVTSWQEFQERRNELEERSMHIKRAIIARREIKGGDLVGWHKTDYTPKEGRIRPWSTSLRRTGRDTLHFSLNGPVHEQFLVLG